MPSIDVFIRRRLLDAKSKLEELDAPFVAAVNAAQKVSLRGIQVPQIAPTSRLPKRYVALLDTCADLTVEVDQLRLITDSLNPERFEGRPPNEVGREGLRHIFDWVIHEQALVEKVVFLIARTIDGYLPGSRKGHKPQILNRYKIKLKDARRRFASSRDGLLHGVGKRGTVYQAISEDQLWEGSVALEISPELIMSSVWQATAKYMRKWHKVKVSQTNGLLDTLGNTLQDLEIEMSEWQR